MPTNLSISREWQFLKENTPKEIDPWNSAVACDDTEKIVK